MDIRIYFRDLGPAYPQNEFVSLNFLDLVDCQLLTSLSTKVALLCKVIVALILSTVRVRSFAKSITNYLVINC